ncbi:hypothetical protein PUN28_007504 [Cardiocondyla obscurior]|uniref:Uncharacterized protein n=1 Tax=Cardiocondyla obscurior TaxID=286306 RepID=A0AAW2G5Q5_9HYME
MQAKNPTKAIVSPIINANVSPKSKLEAIATSNMQKTTNKTKDHIILKENVENVKESNGISLRDQDLRAKSDSKIEKSVRYFFRRSSHSLSRRAYELHKEGFYWSVNEPGCACTRGTSNNDSDIEDENGEDDDWADIMQKPRMRDQRRD